MLFKMKKSFEGKVIKCPRCNTNMEKLKKESVVIDVCTKCKGIWLDKGEIEKLVKIANNLRGGKIDKK